MKKKIIISITALLTLSVLIFLYLQGRTDTFIYYETSTNLPTLEEYKEIGCEGFPELQNFNLIQVNRLKNFNISTGFVLSFEDYKSKKVRRFTCASLKGRGGNSGIRVIFVYEKAEDTHKITFIEIYFKGDQSNEDRERLAKFLKELKEKNMK